MSAEVQDLAIQRNLLATEVVRSFGELQLRANGSSMLPAIWPGDLVKIESRNLSDIQSGEIVLYLREERLFLHRVLSKREAGDQRLLITQGDAMPRPDPAIPEDALLGVVTAICKFGVWDEPHPAVGPLFLLVRWALRRSDWLQRILLRLHQAWRELPSSMSKTVTAKG